MNNIQKNQIAFLLIVQLAPKTKVLNTIRITLFFTNFGKKLNLFRNLEDNRLTKSAFEKASTLK